LKEVRRLQEIRTDLDGEGRCRPLPRFIWNKQKDTTEERIDRNLKRFGNQVSKECSKTQSLKV
jgi:hypothetical protein